MSTNEPINGKGTDILREAGIEIKEETNPEIELVNEIINMFQSRINSLTNGVDDGKVESNILRPLFGITNSLRNLPMTNPLLVLMFIIVSGIIKNPYFLFLYTGAVTEIFEKYKDMDWREVVIAGKEMREKTLNYIKESNERDNNDGTPNRK